MRKMCNDVFIFSDKTVKLWKVSERYKRPEGYNLKDDNGLLRDPNSITTLRVPCFKPMELMVEASPRRVFANAHTYHINSISVNSDQQTYLSADDLRVNLWHLEITDQSFSILCCGFTFTEVDLKFCSHSFIKQMSIWQLSSIMRTKICSSPL